MPRCKHCLSNAEAENGHCPVCGIIQDKKSGALSPDEKKVRFHARSIRVLAMLHLIGAAIGIISVNVAGLPPALSIYAAINIPLAFGLAQFNFWGYRFATVYYFLIGIVNVISVNIIGILIVLIALYIVGNKTSKAIFERRVLEL